MGLARKYPAQRAEPPTAATAHRKGWRKGHRSVAALHREHRGQGSCSGPDQARTWRWEQNQWPQRPRHGPEPETKACGLQRRLKDRVPGTVVEAKAAQPSLAAAMGRRNPCCHAAFSHPWRTMKDRGAWTVGVIIGAEAPPAPGPVGGLWECLDTGSSNVVNFRETLENLRLDSHKILTPLSQQGFSKVRDWGRGGIPVFP